MTVTAKPTYTIWDDRTRQRNFLFKRNGLRDVEISAELMEDTVSVISETGLTPRQLLDCYKDSINRYAELSDAWRNQQDTLLEQRDVLQERVRELEAVLESAQQALSKCARPTDSDLKMSSRDAWALCVAAEKKARAALAKCGEGM